MHRWIAFAAALPIIAMGPWTDADAARRGVPPLGPAGYESGRVVSRGADLPVVEQVPIGGVAAVVGPGFVGRVGPGLAGGVRRGPVGDVAPGLVGGAGQGLVGGAGQGLVGGRGGVGVPASPGVLRRAGIGGSAAGVRQGTVAEALARVAGGRYVAMGDSFTAGPLIPRQRGKPFACLRSDHNYPSLVAHALRVGEFADVSCSAATIADLFRPQHVLFGDNPAQLAAVTPDTALVTVGIGGNDLGFSRTLYTCAGLSISAPKGAPCMRHFGTTLTDRVAATGPKIATVLRTIHQRAPRALVLVVGYLRILPSRTGCWPSVPASAGDVPFLDGVERSMNRLLADEARRGGALFVDNYRGGTGHDMCSSRRWVEPILISHAAMPVHPNALGMRVVAGRVLATIAATRPAAR